MSITIIRAGLHDAIQDEGRYGYRHLGINTGGAMDRNAMHLANILAGNDPGEAVLEMHFPAAAILFNTDALIVLTGADFFPKLNGDPFPMWQPVLVQKNAVLHFDKRVSGARTYLSIAGGLLATSWLGSYSTNLQAGMGGYKGRLLKKGDEINVGNAGFKFDQLKNHKILHWHIKKPGYDNRLGVLPGRQWAGLPVKEQQLFLENEFTITARANRMGYQLTGPGINIENAGELASAAVNFGAIQLLPGGQLIILGADHQATGGYPVIAHVIAAHHHKLAQLAAGEKIVFEMISYEDALSLISKQQQYLLQLQNAVNLRLTEILK